MIQKKQPRARRVFLREAMYGHGRDVYGESHEECDVSIQRAAVIASRTRADWGESGAVMHTLLTLLHFDFVEPISHRL